MLMLKVNYIYIIKKIFFRFLLISTFLIVLIFPLKLKYKTSFDNALNSISSIRSYQGLVLDDSGLGSAILNVFEKTSQIKLSQILISKEGRVVFSRNFSETGGYLDLGFLKQIDLHGQLDDYQVEAVGEIHESVILLILFGSFLFLLIIEVALNVRNASKAKESSLFVANEIARYSQQVAHDIRSPLAALEMISTQLVELSEDKRLIIRNSINRIRDIANSLGLRSNVDGQLIKAASNYEHDSFKVNAKTNSELLMPIVDLIVTEKRLQFRDKLGIQIDFNQTEDSYGLFSKINTNDFKRVLSNIINNAVEAISAQHGHVSVDLSSFEEFNLISIKDNGKGIPENLIDKLGIRGVTINKDGGTGLGLYHAKTTVESWGGRVEIKSSVDRGTIVCIYVPKQNTPQWFVPALIVKENSKIIVFDDDQSIHQIWKERFEELPCKNLRLLHFSNPNDLRVYYRKNFADLDDCVFLMDYEILNHIETGLDLIEGLGVQNKSVLVTSHFEESAIRERCGKSGVRLIPKSMSGFVPIHLVKD